MRKKIVAGNWKMNLLQNDAKLLSDALNQGLERFGTIGSSVIIFPGFTLLDSVLHSATNFKVGAQNFYPERSGAYTGEVSVEQIKDLNLEYVLIGHSERRLLFSENDEMIRLKLVSALENNLKPILCLGETLNVRESGTHFDYVSSQLSSALNQLNADDISRIIIAYEPVWAIGTGITATANQADEMHAHIRNWLAHHFSSEIAEQISILYGGSCNDSNAKDLFSCPNVDGGLIGGASLNPEQFLSIINIMNGLF